MIKVIAFDADDTLWHNETFYLETKEKLKRLLTSHVDPALVGDTLDELEVRNVNFYGYGIKSFALSMIETATRLRGDRIQGADIEQIIGYVKSMLKAELTLFEGAEGALAELSPRYDLMVITKGDQFEQEQKIARSGLAGYFRFIEIVSDKTRSDYQRLLDKYDIAPEEFLMVGNSLRSDVKPVLEIGGQAIYIPYALTWSHEHVPDKDLKGYQYHELEHIGQVPELMQRLNSRPKIE